jgi:Zn-dependent protease with chaperone function
MKAGPLAPAIDDLPHIVRRERTARLIERTGGSIDRWLRDRHAKDVDSTGQYVGRHELQRVALRALLVEAAKTMRMRAKDLSADLRLGDFFDECRSLDEAAIWLERVWEFYRAKFDQRDDPAFGPVVRAADEIVWSCYHDVMRRARGGRHPPQPLPFVASEYSPAALESDKPVPHQLETGGRGPAWTEGLRAATATVPVTLLRLPPWCVHDPWWLAFIAHEVGHHVQTDLALTTAFGQAVARAVSDAGGTREESVAWSGWSREIFADVFSIMMLGPGAVRAIEDIERSNDANMLRSTRTYPPPRVRVYLMQRTAELLNCPVEGHAAARSRDAFARAADLADATVALALGPLPGRAHTLRELCDFDAGPYDRYGAVDIWADRLLDGTSAAEVPDTETARLIVAGSLEAWHRISRMSDAGERDKARETLAATTLTALEKSAPPIRRAPLMEGVLPADAGAGLAEVLIHDAKIYRPAPGAAN